MLLIFKHVRLACLQMLLQFYMIRLVPLPLLPPPPIPHTPQKLNNEDMIRLYYFTLRKREQSLDSKTEHVIHVYSNVVLN